MKFSSVFVLLAKNKVRHIVKFLFSFKSKNKQNSDTENEIMTWFLYSGNFNLNLPLPTYVKSILSFTPCITFDTHTHTHTRAHTRTGSPVGLHWQNSTHLRHQDWKHSGQNSHSVHHNIYSTQSPTLLYARGQRKQASQFNTNWKQCFTEVGHLIFRTKPPTDASGLPVTTNNLLSSPRRPSSQVHL